MAESSHDLITDRVVSTAERIEEYDDPDDVDPLEVRIEASLDGEPRKVTLVLGTGGPHIELDVTNGSVYGSWGGDEHTTHVRNTPVLKSLEDRYVRHWNENVRA